jgi:hypothetical protein
VKKAVKKTAAKRAAPKKAAAKKPKKKTVAKAKPKKKPVKAKPKKVLTPEEKEKKLIQELKAKALKEPVTLSKVTAFNVLTSESLKGGSSTSLALGVKDLSERYQNMTPAEKEVSYYSRLKLATTSLMDLIALQPPRQRTKRYQREAVQRMGPQPHARGDPCRQHRARAHQETVEG